MVAYPPETEKILRHLPAMANMARRVAVQAGDAIMVHYDESGFHGLVEHKADGSPVTIADLAADQVIRTELTQHFPGIPLITEETADQVNRQAVAQADHFWLVDGLDGTKSFRRGDRDFTVNIALIHEQTPLLGVIYAPALGEGYAGVLGDAPQAWRWHDDRDRDQPIQVRPIPPEGVTLLTSITDGGPGPRLQPLIDRVKLARHLRRNSSIKFCDVATGRADLYPRLRGNSYWDTAAGDAILRAAGGTVVDLAGQALRYDPTSADFANHGFIACNDFSYFSPILDDLREEEVVS